MKKKKILSLTMASLLLASPLVSCSQIPSIEETQLYKVNIASSEEYKVVGLSSNGYRVNDHVTLGIYGQNGYEITGVSGNAGLEITRTDDIVEFTMPSSEVTLIVTTAADPISVLDKALDEISVSLHVKTKETEVSKWTYNDGSISYTSSARLIESQMIEGFNLITRYESVSGDSSEELIFPDIDVSETKPYDIYLFAEDGEGNNTLTTASLEIDNKIHHYEVTNSATDQAYTWRDMFANPFELLEGKDFTVDENDSSIYHLDTTNPLLEPAYRSLAQIFYGSPVYEYKVSELSLKLENGKIVSYEGSFETVDFTGFVYTSYVRFSGEVIDDEPISAPTPIEGEEDATFTSAMTSLKNQNYTLEVLESGVDWDDNEVNTYTTARSNGGEKLIQSYYEENVDPKAAGSESTQEYYYEQKEEEGWGGTTEYSIIQATNIKGKYYTFGSEREDLQIVNMLPTFEISSLFFTKDSSGAYVLKDSEDLPFYTVIGDSSLYNPFGYSDLEAFKVEISDTSVKFSNVTSSSYSDDEYVTFTNIGTTTISETCSSDISSFTKWEDFFKTETIVTNMLQIVPSEVLNILPLPYSPDGGNLSNIVVEENYYGNGVSIIIGLDTAGDYQDVQYNDLLVCFSEGLVANGFVYDRTETYYYAFNKVMDVNGVSSEVVFEFGLYSGNFAVDIYITAV